MITLIPWLKSDRLSFFTHIPLHKASHKAKANIKEVGKNALLAVNYGKRGERRKNCERVM